jgi:hypothetical protein
MARGDDTRSFPICLLVFRICNSSFLWLTLAGTSSLSLANSHVSTLFFQKKILKYLILSPRNPYLRKRLEARKSRWQGESITTYWTRLPARYIEISGIIRGISKLLSNQRSIAESLTTLCGTRLGYQLTYQYQHLWV